MPLIQAHVYNAYIFRKEDRMVDHQDRNGSECANCRLHRFVNFLFLFHICLHHTHLMAWTGLVELRKWPKVPMPLRGHFTSDTKKFFNKLISDSPSCTTYKDMR